MIKQVFLSSQYSKNASIMLVMFQSAYASMTVIYVVLAPVMSPYELTHVKTCLWQRYVIPRAVNIILMTWDAFGWRFWWCSYHVFMTHPVPDTLFLMSLLEYACWKYQLRNLHVRMATLNVCWHNSTDIDVENVIISFSKYNNDFDRFCMLFVCDFVVYVPGTPAMLPCAVMCFRNQNLICTTLILW